MENFRAWLILHSIKGIGSKSFIKLINTYGSVEKILDKSKFNYDINEIIEIEKQIKFRNIKIITYEADIAKKLSLPIFYLSNDLPYNKCIAIVGKTSPTNEGIELALKFSKSLSKNNFTIVSGYAKGIDTYAHIGAIKYGKTIAVLPFGILNFRLNKELEPFCNEFIMNAILFSQFFPTDKWSKSNAMIRNKTIANLSNAVILIEPERGAISTAIHAIKQCKQIFLVESKTTINLNGIKKVIQPEEVIESLNN